MGAGIERMGSCVCTAEPLRSSPETITTLLAGDTPIQNKQFKAWGKKESIGVISSILI